MTRVSEKSNQASLNFAIQKAKSKLENLQLKGANLKRINKPSDDPVGNVELLTLRSEKFDSKQFKRNSNFAKTYLNYTESSLAEVNDIVVRAKELAIAQASDIYGPNIRQTIAKEVSQLKKQLLNIANRRLGNRYIFAGHKTLGSPFTSDGKYKGDEGRIYLEVAKDFFAPVNLHGSEVFFRQPELKLLADNPLNHPKLKLTEKDTRQLASEKVSEGKAHKIPPKTQSATTASKGQKDVSASSKNKTESSQQVTAADATQNKPSKGISIFKLLEFFEESLYTNATETIQNILPEFDDTINRFITLRARVGAILKSIESTETMLDNEIIVHETQRSKVEDADVAELYSELQKQQNILQATYKTTQNLISQSLMDFLR